MKRFASLVLANVLFLWQPGLLSAAPTVAGAPVEVPVVLSTTGYLSFLGREQQRALSILEDVVNTQQGGLYGRPVEFVVEDDQSNPQVAVQLASKVVADGHAPMLLGPLTTSGCNAVFPLLKTGPVMYCISPAFQPPANSLGFVSNTNTNDQAVALVRFSRLHGWKRMAFLTTTDAAGQSLDKAFAVSTGLPENKDVQVVAHEHFGGNDLSVAAQLAKIASTHPQVVVLWATGTPFGTALRNLHDAGMEVPVIGGTGNMTFAQLANYSSFLPTEMYFPGVRALTHNGTAAGPIRDAQRIYQKAFASAGVRPDLADVLIWDPALIVLDTLRHIGPNGSAEAARTYLESLHSFVGVNGLYDFRDGSQRGLGINTVIMDRWDAGKNDFVAVSRPGGYL